MSMAPAELCRNCFDIGIEHLFVPPTYFLPSPGKRMPNSYPKSYLKYIRPVSSLTVFVPDDGFHLKGHISLNEELTKLIALFFYRIYIISNVVLIYLNISQYDNFKYKNTGEYHILISADMHGKLQCFKDKLKDANRIGNNMRNKRLF